MRQSFLGRLLAPDQSGESPVLRMLGYYSAESKAIAAGKSIYNQLLLRSQKAAALEFDNTSEFVPQYEMLAIHIYITLKRLRAETGSEFESDVKVAMQTLFDIFWTDVRHRMMMKEHKLTLLTSSRWIKECERNFFSMAVSFDECWADDAKMDECIAKRVTCLKKDMSKVARLRKYMQRELHRLEKVSVSDMWDGTCWDDKYRAVLH